MGYRGFLLKNLAQLNGETVKNWVHCNSTPGTATNNIVTLHHIRKIIKQLEKTSCGALIP